jgi:hypothetical protein
MIEKEIDLWEIEVDVRCITTNGTVTSQGTNIMGGGCAKGAADRYPSLPYVYGSLIKNHGHHVFLIPVGPQVFRWNDSLVMFPTKETIKENASLETIERSALELDILAEIYGWNRIAVPRPGAGLGGLKWEDVKPILEPIFDDRYIILDFPKAQ